MALDESILNNSIARSESPQIRIYRWDRPSLSIGAHVAIDQAVLRRCAQENVAVVRRATGGGAVLHTEDVTYSVVAPIIPGGVLDAYRWVAVGLTAGLKRLGIEAGIVEHARRADALACFATPTGADLQAQGRKICGSAQVRRKGWFLQHGSIPLCDDRPQTQRLLATSILNDDSTFVRDFCDVTWKGVAEAVLEGFRDAWGLETASRSPSDDEFQEALDLARSKQSALLTL